MTGIVYCMASPKGGSGKTTLAATFATLLGGAGFKVLLVDCDEATHGLSLLYLDEIAKEIKTADNDLFGVFDGGSRDRFRALEVSSENVLLVPATYKLGKHDHTTNEEFRDRIVEIVKFGKQKFDFLFIDAQAGADEISQIVMESEISDEVIIVSEYDPMSTAGVERMKAIVGEGLSYDRTWILLNKLLPEFVSKFDEFFSVSKYLPPIPWTADAVRAYARRSLAINLDSPNQYTLAVLLSLKELIPNEHSVILDNWADEKASELRRPISTQYEQLEKKLAQLLEFRSQVLRRQGTRDRIQTLALAGVVVSVLALVFDLFTNYSMNIASVYIMITSGILFVSMGYMLHTYFSRRNALSNNTNSRMIDIERTERQLAVVREQLKELELLKEANLDHLVNRDT